MGVTFVLGRAGTGKTRRCVEAITHASHQDPLGPPLIWITPRQATFEAERALTCASGSPGLCRARVLSFHRLAEEVRSLSGAASLDAITQLGRQMVIGRLLRVHQASLKFFRSSARQIGLSAELDATFAELEHAGHGVLELGGMIAQLENDRAPSPELDALLAKLHDVHLLYGAYGTFLGQERLDPHRRLEQVIASMESCPLFRNSTIYVDGFARFSKAESRILTALGKASRVEIMLLLDPDSPVVRQPEFLPDDHSLFYETEQTYRRLWFELNEAGVNIREPVLLRNASRFTSITLGHLEHELFENRLPRRPDTGDVAMIEASDKRAEVDAAAREINQLLREGFRLRDIGVLVRELDAYHSLLDSSFAAHGICYFVDRRRTAAHHPLLQLVRATLQIARYDWPHEAAMTLLKCGLAGVEPAEADALENYVLEHRIRGAGGWERAEEWHFHRRSIARDDAGETTDAAGHDPGLDVLRRRVLSALAPILSLAAKPGDKPPVRSTANAIFAMLTSFAVPRRLAQWAKQAREAGRLEEAAEHEQVWAALVDLFEQLVELLGDESLNLHEFADVLESGLETFDLALTPPTVDQLLVGQVDRTRCPPLRAVILLGLNQGQFPKSAADGHILSDADRRELRQRRVELEPDTSRQRLNEQLLGYIAFTRASERLIVCRSASSTAGRSVEPSPFWADLQSVLRGVTVRKVEPLTMNPSDHVGTGRQLVSALMRQGRAGRMEEPWPGLYQWLIGEGRHHKSVARPLAQAWGALNYHNDARLSHETGRQLFPEPLQASVGQLESFAACPFQHFARYGLRLGTRHNAQVSALDLSNVYRNVLQSLVQEALHKRADWAELAQTISPQRLGELVQQVGVSLRDELMLSTARNRYLLDRIEKTLEQVLAAQVEALRRGRFTPTIAGAAFGPSRRMGPLRISTPARSTIELRGQIDRIDLAEDGSAKVIDYKLGSQKVDWTEAYHGLSLRLLTHLLVLQANGTQLTGRPLMPAAALYVRLSRGLERVDHPSKAVDPADPLFNLRIKPRGLFDATSLPLLDVNIRSGKSDVVSAKLTQDERIDKRSSDAVTPEELASILNFVQSRLGELADRVLAAEIGVLPYYINGETPCPRCEFRDVCRFETNVNSYRFIERLKRDDAIAKMQHAPRSGS